ncbi:MAG: ribosome maturation factor, partial [Helicobacter japonicus]|nr:ribosome maturation factor [Helicobacter japonicus]
MLSLHTQEKIAKMASTFGLYIYDIAMLKENEQCILRISITRKAPMQVLDSQNSNAVSLQDCQDLSEVISPLLDVEEANLPPYFLEVSSPGLERILKTHT